MYNLLPYNGYKDVKRHRDLRVGDTCLLRYDNTFGGVYRLSRVVETYPDQTGVVRTLQIQYHPKDKRDSSLPYRGKNLDSMKVGVQRLVLIIAVEEISYNDYTCDKIK